MLQGYARHFRYMFLSGFPTPDRPAAHAQFLRQPLAGQPQGFAQHDKLMRRHRLGCRGGRALASLVFSARIAEFQRSLLPTCCFGASGWQGSALCVLPAFLIWCVTAEYPLYVLFCRAICREVQEKASLPPSAGGGAAEQQDGKNGHHCPHFLLIGRFVYKTAFIEKWWQWWQQILTPCSPKVFAATMARA